MEKKIEKGEFISQVEAFARMMSEMTSEKDGVKRGLIILASESVESEDGTQNKLWRSWGMAERSLNQSPH